MWSVSVSSWPLTSILFEAGLGLKQVCSWLATCFRHAFDMLPTCLRHAHAILRPGLQLARIMECGLNSVKRKMTTNANLYSGSMTSLGAAAGQNFNGGCDPLLETAPPPVKTSLRPSRAVCVKFSDSLS